MNAGPIFDRVYTDLKGQLMAGRWVPGAHLEPAAIGEDLGASITPVRDALHRLVGERLIEAPRHDGFWVQALTETRLRGLYAWQGDLLAWAMRRARAGPVLAGEMSAAALFEAIALASDVPELAFALRNIGERLAAFQDAEAEVLKGMAEELQSVVAFSAVRDVGGMRRALAAYHKRRQRAAPAILEARHRRSNPHPLL